MNPKNYRPKLSDIMIGSILFIMVLFAFVIMSIGYFGFTSLFTEEYNESAYRAAETALNELLPDEIDDYLAMGNKRLSTIRDAIENNTLDQVDPEPTPEEIAYTNSYYTSKEYIRQLCDLQKMSVIYVIVPDVDYEHYTCVYNCLNSSSTYTPWEIGKVVETSAEDYKVAYANLMENRAMKQTVVRIENLKEGRPHITSLIPVRDSSGKVIAILCAQRYVEELVEYRRLYLQGVGAITVIAIIIMVVIISGFLKKELVGPLENAADEAIRFSRENIMKEDVPDVRGKSRVKEIHLLADALEKLEQDTVKNIDNITKITKETERIGTEIALASQIQMGMLPDRTQFITDRSEFDIFASMRPAKEVGGDFYDFFMIDDHHVAILIADVSDKGVGAAFFMAISKTLIKSRARMGGTAADIIQYTDGLISEKNAAGMFVTVWMGIIDLENGHVDACNAGHDYPAIMKQSEDFVIEKTPHGPPVAFIPGMAHVGYEFDLKPGERIFLYTDGLNEAKAADGTRFGNDRILKVLNENKTSDNEKLLFEMKKAVNTFVGDEPQFDDMTMLGFTYDGIKH